MTLLNSLISHLTFLVDLLESTDHISANLLIISLAIVLFLPFQPECHLFLYFYFLFFAQDRTFSVILKENAEKRHPGLVPNRRYRAFINFTVNFEVGCGCFMC